MPCILRKGTEWCRRSDGPAIKRFHEIAQNNGSHARWLFQTCVLATDYPDELEKDFPYDKWRDEALKGKPGITPGGA